MRLPHRLLLAAVLIAAGCQGEQGPAGPLLVGNLTGFVSLSDEEGNRISNSAGVTVMLEGSPRATTTDSVGRWTLNDVPTGTYTVVYTKENYFDERQEQLQFLGGTTLFLPRVSMFRLPTFEVLSLTVTGAAGSDAITIEGTLSALTPSWRPVLVIYGLTNEVSVDAGRHVFFHESYAYPGLLTFRSTIYVDSSTRSYYGLTTGQWLYVRAHPAGLGPLSRYDFTAGSYVPSHYGVTTSPLDSVLIP